MARKPRVDMAGLCYHITQRGHNRSASFLDEQDYIFYLTCMQLAAEKYEVAVHAYVLMGNHVHLLISTRNDGGMSRFMQHIDRRYVRYFNYHHGRSGTLWGGRYHSEVIQTDLYLLACYRYIELNSVRAGMVARPSEYPWSSARCHGLAENNPYLQHHPLYEALGTSPELRCQNYRKLFRAGSE
ncbi:MAG: transposase [Gammaproteobacteria bacterium]|nr:transposase [Gammaproteobacteria bacterium]MCF6231163.1 transposase [Gammaproteobacteria bacterium]